MYKLACLPLTNVMSQSQTYNQNVMNKLDKYRFKLQNIKITVFKGATNYRSRHKLTEV